MSKYYINNSDELEKEFEILGKQLDSLNFKTNPFVNVYQSRTTEDTGTFKLSNYKT